MESQSAYRVFIVVLLFKRELITFTGETKTPQRFAPPVSSSVVVV
jgi:hypothetical protein